MFRSPVLRAFDFALGTDRVDRAVGLTNRTSSSCAQARAEIRPQRINVEVFDGSSAGVGPVVAAAALSRTEVNPVGRPITGAGKAGALDKRLHEPHRPPALGAKPAKRSQVDQRCAQRLDRSQSRQSLGLEGPSGLTPAPATANWQCHQSALLQLAKKVARRDVLELAGG